jgi:hypothetical protein
MFKIAANPTFTHNVDVFVPTDGGHSKQSFKATFRVAPTAESDETAPDLSTISGSTTFLRDVIVGMSELVGADDQPLTYSDQVRDELLKLPYVRSALARTYFTAVNKASVGN